MKQLLALLLSIVIVGKADAQQTTGATFPAQLKSIITAAANQFKTFQGEIRSQKDNDIIYLSTLTLTGTKENEINHFTEATSYKATIAEGITKAEAIKLLEAWKKKIISCLGKDYEPLPNDVKFQNLGYTFMSESRAIMLDVVESSIEKGKHTFYILIL